VNDGCNVVFCHVQHVRAGDVHEGERAFALPRIGDDVVQMVSAIEKKRRVRISGSAVATGMHEMETQHHFLRHAAGDGGCFILN